MSELILWIKYEYSQTQQTPNPIAQGPLETPPCILHSYVFMQTPAKIRTRYYMQILLSFGVLPFLLPSFGLHSSSNGTGKKFNTATDEILLDPKKKHGFYCSLYYRHYSRGMSMHESVGSDGNLMRVTAILWPSYHKT